MRSLNRNVEQVVTRGVAGGNVAARVINRHLSALLVLALLGFSGILFQFNPSQHRFYPACMFHELTGLLCPGCGSLRAIHQLLHGHLTAAFQFNPLLILSLPFLLWGVVRLVTQKAKRQSPKVNLRPFWIWASLAVFVVFGVLRNLPLAPLAWFGR